MNKKELIKKLKEIKGNPEICIWNGIVQDYMKIGEIQNHELVKHSFEYYKTALRYEAQRDGKEFNEQEVDRWIEERLKIEKWELPNEFVKQEDMNCWYGDRRKKIILLCSKLRGKRIRGRSGSISY